MFVFTPAFYSDYVDDLDRTKLYRNPYHCFYFLFRNLEKKILGKKFLVTSRNFYLFLVTSSIYFMHFFCLFFGGKHVLDYFLSRVDNILLEFLVHRAF